MTKVEMEKDITGKYENILPSEGAYSTKNNLQTCNLQVRKAVLIKFSLPPPPKFQNI